MTSKAVWPFGLLLRTRDQFSLFFVSFFSAKVLHLYSHRTSLPILLFILYLPTFLLPDAALLVVGQTVIFRHNSGTVRKWIGGLLTSLTAAASAATIAFYVETGGEVQWMAAGSLANDPSGIKILLSGTVKFSIALLALSVVAWLITPSFYNGVSYLIDNTCASLQQAWLIVRGKQHSAQYEPLVNVSDDEASQKHAPQAPRSTAKSLLKAVGILTAIVTVVVLQTVRPRNPPYAHMSGSLPLTLFGAFLFNPINSEFCLPVAPSAVDFPFEQFAKQSWEGGRPPVADWKPESEGCRRQGHTELRDLIDNGAEKGQKGGYDPTCDPLKVSHLEQPVLEDLVAGIKAHNPSIKHVLQITMESTRKDMFPFRKDSHVYDTSITDQYDSQDILDEQMGFKNVILKETIKNPSSKHYPPKEPECNYFGFPEPETLPYMRDLFLGAQEKRLFISHVTSTTHHPFATPESWNETESYLAHRRWRTEDPFDNYLNTIKYQDEWLGQIFDLLEEVGAINETLVVLVGDHGLAFDTPDGSTSTFENGHISNFAIPLVFVHPQLPRIQLQTKAQPTSIIPTVLDLLLQTNSLNASQANAAGRLIHRYQGQSLIRDTSPSRSANVSSAKHQEDWHFSVINPGGSMMSIGSSASPYRLIMPLCSTASLRFTDSSVDPLEQKPIEAWTMKELVKKMKKKHGGRKEAIEWAKLAERLGRWWFWEQRERWSYHKAARSTDRSAIDSSAGKLKKEHWWET
ncbi:sulfatase domain-containing protein [Neofusicoccum parvum]|nr:sulfatase domain-containing protein [Neofusicoccum parvum]